MSRAGPLIVQSDHTLLLELESPQYAEARDFLGGFAELVKSPEFIHTYRVSPLSLWNAAAMGLSLDEITAGLARFARYEVPAGVSQSIRAWHGAYGTLVLEPHTNERLRLTVHSDVIAERLARDASLKPFWLERDGSCFLVAASERGNVKHALVRVGYPVKDLCGYLTGAPCAIELRAELANGSAFRLRDYQLDAVEAFYLSGRADGGSGVLVLPCGAGKTVIGLGVMSRVGTQTLIVTTNNVSVHQWRDELLARTTLRPEDVGEYTGLAKELKPVTITTYQMLTHRASRDAPMENLQVFSAQNWGLVIYDEVHLLPAPVFRATTDIQAKRRLGLTATLVREDGREDDVFALIGPKRCDVPWKVLETRGYIAEARCTEYRLTLPPDEERAYAHAEKRDRFRIAAENPRKIELAKELIARHPEDGVLVIGQYIAQVEAIAKALRLPIITGKTPDVERERLYSAFKRGTVPVLVVSKVANFAVDLPDASVLIQVSGAFGSRQEEAQRLGRILRPKKRRSQFYTLVSKGTDEQTFGTKRQLFLVEQGYQYEIRYWDAP